MNSTKYDEFELTSLKYNEIRELCKENGLKASGKKVDLIQSLTCIPALYEDDNDSTLDESVPTISDGTSVSSPSISDCTLDETVCGPNLQQRPVFGDISVITINSPVGSSGGRAKKRKIDILNSERANEGNVIPTPTATDANCLRRLAADVKGREDNLEDLIRRFEEPAKAIASLIEKKKAELDDCRCAGDNYLREVLEQKLVEKELHLRNEHEEEIKKLKTDKELSERLLKVDFSKQLQQKEVLIMQKTNEAKLMRTVRENNLRERNDLNLRIQILTNNLKIRDEQRNKLTISVDELKKNLEGKENDLKKQVELMQVMETTNVNGNVMESIEDEFTCIICQELFIHAVTLPCAHSFCEMCLRTWFKTKKTCPVCRHDLKLKVLYSIVLDSVVECIVENSDAEAKRKRTNLLRLRNELKRTTDAAADPQGIKKMFYKVGDVETHIPGPSNQPVANAANNRRRSRSQSPARLFINRPLANNNNNNNNNNQAAVGYNNVQRNFNPYHHYNRIRCFNCGDNHHIRDCPRTRR